MILYAIVYTFNCEHYVRHYFSLEVFLITSRNSVVISGLVDEKLVESKWHDTIRFSVTVTICIIGISTGVYNIQYHIYYIASVND